MNQLIVRRRIAAAVIACSACTSEAFGGAAPALQAQSLMAAACAPDAPDHDADGLCDDAEIELGTDPNEPDSDGDALTDGDEALGYREGEELILDLPALGADPRHKDIFLEIDYYRGFRPSAGVIEMVVQAFALAPVDNPDGATGVRLHVDLDDEISSGDAIAMLDYEFAGVDRIKATYFDRARRLAYHYGLFANQYRDPWGREDSSGLSRDIGAADFIVTLGGWSDRSELIQAGTLMHELGHNLGLQHGGHDGFNYKPHYLSLMNYHYQIRGLIKDGLTTLDYARVSVTGLDERNLSERQGILPANPRDSAELAKYAPPRVCERPPLSCAYTHPLQWRLPGPLDFDRDDVEDTTPVAFDLDGDDQLELYEPLGDDWSKLFFAGGEIGDLSHSRWILPESPPCLGASEASRQGPIGFR